MRRKCAALAEAEGASPALITASLLARYRHDLIHDLGREPAKRGIDDRHEVLGQEWLTRWFARCRCHGAGAPARARQTLSDRRRRPLASRRCRPASVRSLELQGGPFSAGDAAEFIAQLLHAAEAVRLRRWDEGAKVPGKPTPDLAHFAQYIEASVKSA